MLNSSIYRWIQWGWTGLWMACILIFLMLACCNHPSLDDYNYAVLMQENGLLKSQALWYNDWSGRYFSNLMLSLNPLVFHSFTGYKILTSAVILGFFGTLTWFIFRIYGPLQERRNVFPLIALCSLVYSLLLPTFSEGFYWMSAALTYHLPAIFSMLLLMIACTEKHTAPGKAARTVAGIALCVFIAGSNELSLIALIYLNSLLVGFYFWKTRKLPVSQLVFLLVSVLCGALALSSPGNANRSELFTQGINLIGISVQSGSNLFQFLGRNLLPLAVFGLLTAITYWINIRNTSPTAQSYVLYVHPLLSLAAVILLLYLLFWASWYATQAPMIARAENVPFFWLFLGWIWIVRNTIILLKKSGKQFSEKILKLSYALALLACTYFFVRENNLRSAAGDLLLNRAFTYDREISEQVSALEHCTSDTCRVNEPSVKPVMLYIGSCMDPAMPQQYISWCRYFGKKSILIRPIEEP